MSISIELPSGATWFFPGHIKIYSFPILAVEGFRWLLGRLVVVLVEEPSGAN